MRLEIGTRWFWQGRHYTITGRETRLTRDGITATMVCAVPDSKPGVRRRERWCDWIEESRFAKTAVPSQEA